MKKFLLLIVAQIVIFEIVRAQSCPVSCPSGYTYSTRCCNAGSCSINLGDGNPYTGCTSGGCSANPECTYGNCDLCCECNPPPPPSCSNSCGSSCSSICSCPGGTVQLKLNEYAYKNESYENYTNEIVIGDIVVKKKYLNLNAISFFEKIKKDLTLIILNKYKIF